MTNTGGCAWKEVNSVLLGKNDILTADFAQKIMPMARFRNRLVHLYWEVDNENIYEIMQNDLDDFTGFATQISEFVKEYQEKNSVEN